MTGPRTDEAVDFVVIGAMKSMTTSLLATLEEHPQVAASTIKETQYLVAEVGWSRGPDWYASLFAHAAPGQLRGEASPQYTFFPTYGGVPERLVSVAPSARLVYLVREPVQRTLSQYRHARARGVETRPLRDAVLEDARYQNPSRYWTQLEQWRAVVPDEQLLVVDNELLAREPARALAEICAHIGADPALAPSSLARRNVAEDRRVLRPALRSLSDHARVLRAARRARRRLPASLGDAWDRRAYVENPPVEPDPELEARLAQLFETENRELGRYLGDRAPAWAC